MYQDTLQRWGDATLFAYSEDLFFTIFKDKEDCAQFWLAEIDGKIIAGVLIFYWNNVVSYWHGASLKDYFSYYPNNMLHLEITKDAVKKNYSYYDFGPSGGLEGVIRFKESFGTVRLSFDSGHWKKRWGTAKQA
jgi:lipid II:glycine glycyltransferase (peptidoglycan interpeptide bridge formation enzyme)